MKDQGQDSGTELVLDNRKIIIAFVLLICVCGAFFLIGFVEGKRQAKFEASESVPAASIPGAPAQKDAKGPAAVSSAKPIEESAKREPLDRYKIESRGGEPSKRAEAGKEVKPTDVPASAPQEAGKKLAIQPSVSKPPAAALTAAPSPPARASYSVQVGAFRFRREAEAKAETLKAKGYECVIEAPVSPNELFLLKVGRFESRADAVAMQLRLNKDGFSTFIKTN